MKKLTLLFTLSVCLPFWACNDQPAGGDIENTYWNLVSYKVGTKKTYLNEGTDISAIFSTDKVSGVSACNRYSAAYSTDGTAMSVSSMSSTEAMCDAINTEQAFLDLLSKTAGYSVLEDGLVLFAEGGQLDFKPMSEQQVDDINYEEGVGKLVEMFPALASEVVHFYPIVRVDRPRQIPFYRQIGGFIPLPLF